MNINSAGAGRINPPANLDDLMKASSPEVIKTVLENAQKLASENEALKQKLLGAMGAAGQMDAKDLALLSAEIGQKLQDAIGGVRHLQVPETFQGANAGSAQEALSRLS